MAVTASLYNSVLEDLVEGELDWEGDTIKCALLGSGYTPDIDSHAVWSDVSAYEVSGTGYTAGGQTLANRLITLDTVNDEVRCDSDDPQWASSTITARYAVVYQDTGTPSTSRLIALMNFGQDYASSNGTFKITVASGGWLKIAQV